MRLFVLFHSAFRRPGALNISHVTEDRERTLCSRRILKSGAQVEEDDRDDEPPDCRSCQRVLDKRRPRT